VDRGYWIPLDKGLAKFLPVDRKFSKVEAMFCLQLDLDNHGKIKPENYYSKQWKWIGETVHRFIKEAKQNPSNETRYERFSILRSVIEDIKSLRKFVDTNKNIFPESCPGAIKAISAIRGICKTLPKYQDGDNK